MEKLRKLLGKRILGLRQEAGLTQEALAEKLDLHGSYVGLLERGVKSPSLDTLSRVAAFFDLQLDELVSTDPDKSEDLEFKRIARALRRVPKKDLKRIYSVLKLLSED